MGAEAREEGPEEGNNASVGSTDGDDEDVVSSGKSNVDKAVLSECAADSSTGAGAVKTGCSRCASDLKMGSS